MRSKNDFLKYNYHFEVHDFGFLLPGLDDILRLKQIYPDFKITCFTVPISKEFFNEENSKHFKIDKYKKWAEIINSYDWMEIGIHGFAHTLREMDVGYNKAVEIIKAGENLFNKIGLEYKKMFVAPYWQYSYDALNALKDNGYVVGLNRNNPIPVPKDLKHFYYNWSFEDQTLPNGPDIIAHGHTTSRGVKNGIAQAYNNIINLVPYEAKFNFLSELMKNKYGKKENC